MVVKKFQTGPDQMGCEEASPIGLGSPPRRFTTSQRGKISRKRGKQVA